MFDGGRLWAMEDLLLVRLLGGRVSHSDSVNRFGLDSFASTRLYPSLRSVNPYTICHFVGYYLYPSLRSVKPLTSLRLTTRMLFPPFGPFGSRGIYRLYISFVSVKWVRRCDGFFDLDHWQNYLNKYEKIYLIWWKTACCWCFHGARCASYTDHFQGESQSLCGELKVG